jgi:hypothetical protein
MDRPVLLFGPFFSSRELDHVYGPPGSKLPIRQPNTSSRSFHAPGNSLEDATGWWSAFAANDEPLLDKCKETMVTKTTRNQFKGGGREMINGREKAK